MDLIQINLACQTKKNLTETKKELEKYVNDETSYEAISLAYIFLKKAKEKKLDKCFGDISARKKGKKTNKPLIIIRGLFPNKFKANTETKYAKILSYADANEWALEELIEQLNEKGIARIHQKYLEQEGADSIKKLEGFTKKKTYSVTKYKGNSGNSGDFIVLFGKKTANSVKFYEGTTNPRIVKMVMRELGLIEPDKKKKKFSV